MAQQEFVGNGSPVAIATRSPVEAEESEAEGSTVTAASDAMRSDIHTMQFPGHCDDPLSLDRTRLTCP